MLDINFIRENPEKVKNGVVSKGYPALLIDQVLQLDKTRRELIQEIDLLRAERNKAASSKDIEKGKEIKDKLQQKEPQLQKIEDDFNDVLKRIPNLPVEGVPEGDESNNQIIKKEGESRKFDFKPRDHVELGEMLDIIDIPRATKVSGSRFAYLKNEGVLLELALVQFAIDILMKEGFHPIFPPALIKQEMTEGLGYWQGGGNENYYFVRDYQKENEGEQEKALDLYLIGTAEHALVTMHSEETFTEKDLPKKYVGFSPAFRREAGSYGRDTKGILRVHQFDKVEMVEFVKEEDDEQERRKMLSLAEGFVKALGLPYQVVKLAKGDLSFPAGETIDIETWIPSQDKYRETHSISTTTDFQARRLNIKYKKDSGAGFAHILNGTALAIGRTIIALLENYQQEDGTVIIPEILRPYTNFSEIRPKK